MHVCECVGGGHMFLYKKSSFGCERTTFLERPVPILLTPEPFGCHSLRCLV